MANYKEHNMSITKTIAKSLAVAGLTMAAAAPGIATAKASEFITIGTGGVTGVYYPAGGAICKFVNRNRKEHNIRCSVESTGGSAYNINTMRAGELDFGVAQSDQQFYAYEGLGQYEQQGAFKELRAVFSLHAEALTIVARKDSGIKDFKDLAGKRVNVGNPGSGQRSTMDVVMKAYNWDRNKFSLTSELKANEQSQALCDNKIDAFVFFAGFPNGSIKEATTTCDAVLVTVNDPTIDKLIANNPYYSQVVIPGGTYTGTPKDTVTFGARATIVTPSSMSDKIVYEVTKAVFENFNTFKRLHPSFSALTKQDMASAALSAPLHPGAVKYYKEVGLK
jgi:TRAP transporter TAXI family solute receptor